MSSEDKRIGVNIAKLRADRSQADIASEMRAYGWKWAQNTVSAVETGERPLRLAEALDLSRILDVNSVEAFAREDEFIAFKLQSRHLMTVREELKSAVERFTEAQMYLAVAGDAALDAGVPQTNELIAPLESWLSVSAAEVVIDVVLGDEQITPDQIADFVEGRSERGGNGHWMNVLYDSNMKFRIREAQRCDGVDQEAP